MAEILLFYGIGCLDIGIWQGDCSISGIIAGYITEKRSYPLWLFLLLGGGSLVGLYIYLDRVVNGDTGRGFTLSDSNVYGSARDINMDELKQVAEIKPKTAAMGTILGQLDETEQRLITTKNIVNFNKNMMVLAPPGSGKTFCIVLPYIVQAIRREESIICTDTKGEIFAKTVELARKHGYIVRRLDLKDPENSDGWDILSEIHLNDIRAKTASQIIMENTGDEKDIHKSAEEALLTALCLYVALNDGIPNEEKTLYNAYVMLFQGASKLDETFKNIRDDPKMVVAYNYYATFVQGSANLRGNVITNLANRLSVLSSPAIRELTSTPDIDLTLPGREKCIYYVEMNDQVNSQKFLSSLFFSFLFWDLCDYADAQPSQRLPIPVNIMIEEAYACGKLPTITNALATVRSRAISITLIAQGIDQFVMLYGEEMTHVILECCATCCCLGTNTKTTAELFEWFSGNATVKVKTEQHTVGEGPIKIGRGYSTGDGRQSLYSSNDVRKIKFGRILLVWQRFDPIMAYTFGIDRHPEYINNNMPQISGKTHIPLSDKKARDFIREKEAERVQHYKDWIENGGDPWPDYTEPEPKYNGPAKNKPIPATIPYPELEKQALAHSTQMQKEKRDALMKELQETAPIPAEDGCDPYVLPEDFKWYGDDQQEESSDETEAEPEQADNSPEQNGNLPEQNSSSPEQNSSSPEEDKKDTEPSNQNPQQTEPENTATQAEGSPVSGNTADKPPKQSNDAKPEGEDTDAPNTKSPPESDQDDEIPDSDGCTVLDEIGTPGGRSNFPSYTTRTKPKSAKKSGNQQRLPNKQEPSSQSKSANGSSKLSEGSNKLPGKK